MDPTPIEDLTVPAVVEHLESVVSQIEQAPILMGHSAGGVFMQLLMDQAAPPASRSTRRRPRASSACRCHRSGRASPSSRTPPTGTRPSGSPSSNGATCSRTRSARRRREGSTSVHIPAAGRVFWAVLANIHPGPDDTHVDYKNPNRAPLLFISARGSPQRPRRSSARTRSTTRRRARSPRSSSTRSARTSCPRRAAGRRSPTTPRLGGRARKGTSHGVGNDDAVAALRRAADRGSSPLFSASSGPSWSDWKTPRCASVRECPLSRTGRCSLTGAKRFDNVSPAPPDPPLFGRWHHPPPYGRARPTCNRASRE